MKDLSIIIVNYNSGELTNQCINSINKTVHKVDYEIIVVDNASPDKSGEKIKKDNIKFIQLEKNIGFSGGNNAAICKSTAKYILLLNPDTIVLHDTIDKIFELYESSKENIGAIGCKIVKQNGELDRGCKRSFPTLFNALCHFSKLDKIFPNNEKIGGYNLTYISEDDKCQVECISGAFMFIKREVITRVGSLDERFFMHSEDIDLCYRINKGGYKILYLPEVSIVHLKGQSSKTSSELVTKHFFESMWLYYKKHYYDKNNIIMNFVVKISVNVIKNIFLIKGRIMNKLIKCN